MSGAFPLPIRVLAFLLVGLLIGALLPHTRATNALYTAGTFFPRAVVTFAALIVFAILSGAIAKLVWFHRRRAGRLFGLIFGAYVGLALASLAYVMVWVPLLTRLPLTAAAAAVACFG